MAATKSDSAALADDAPHLLVVDDDRRIRNLLSRFLLSEGYRVTTAETAAEAGAKLEGLQFRSADPRCDDARRDRLRVCPQTSHTVERADPDADRARRSGEPHRGARERR